MKWQVVWNFLQNILDRFRNPGGDLNQAHNANINDLGVREARGGLLRVRAPMLENTDNLKRAAGAGEVAAHVKVTMGKAW